MSALLHGIDCEVMLGDTLSSTGTTVAKSDLILTNPPFGTKKGGGGPTRDDFTFPTSNRQALILICRGSKASPNRWKNTA